MANSKIKSNQFLPSFSFYFNDMKIFHDSIFTENYRIITRGSVG
jgi:hypothetical protein